MLLLKGQKGTAAYRNITVATNKFTVSRFKTLQNVLKDARVSKRLMLSVRLKWSRMMSEKLQNKNSKLSKCGHLGHGHQAVVKNHRRNSIDCFSKRLKPMFTPLQRVLGQMTPRRGELGVIRSRHRAKATSAA